MRHRIAGALVTMVLVWAPASTSAQAPAPETSSASAERSPKAATPSCEVVVSCETAATCAAQDELVQDLTDVWYLEQGRLVECQRRAQTLDERLRDAEAARVQAEAEEAKRARMERRERRVWYAIISGVAAAIGYTIGSLRR